MERKNKNKVEKRKGANKRVIASSGSAEKHNIRLTVNGKLFELLVGKDINPWHTLAQTLRETLGFTGTKISCDHGECGICTVLIDGAPTLSCITLTVDCDGKSITTIEGLEDPETGELDPLQQAFIDNTAFQCGFCTPGIIMSTKALLNRNPNPTEQDVKEALAGNYCRCISHYQVIKAVMAAAEKVRQN
jgi:aerobic-type carbon monoxide dehydrogenase small subunit (CoxS/CutS family)